MAILGKDSAVNRTLDRDEIMLGMLTVIDRDANVSQRTISRELGVALGLANAYLKRCIHKGLVKIKQVPRRRYAYYLTPNGFTEKARLTGEYLSASLTFFRRAKSQLATLLRDCERTGKPRIALAGKSELAEIAVLAAQDYDVSLVALIDGEHAGKRFAGLPIVGSLRDCPDVDVIIVTGLGQPEILYRTLERELGYGRVLAPPLLRITGASQQVVENNKAPA